MEPQKIGAAIDRLHILKQQKKVMEATLAGKAAEIAEAEREVMSQLGSLELEKAGGSLASVSITRSTKPVVEDWKAFYEYIQETGYFHLLDRRPSATGCREIFEANKQIPGVLPASYRKLNIRSA